MLKYVEENILTNNICCSFAKFFSNINKWAEMAKLSEDFRSKIKLLKDTFSVTCNTFKEYYPLFEKMFNVPDAQEFEQSKQHRPRKQRYMSLYIVISKSINNSLINVIYK